MKSRKVEIRYATGWLTAVLHFEAAGASGSCGGWRDAEMQLSSREGWQEVSVHLAAEAERLEFVFKNKNGNEWDNPQNPNRFGRRNYLVDLEKKEGDTLVVVADGEAAVVYVHPKGENRVLLVTDLDGTLIGHDDYLAKFKKHWTLHHLWRGSKLVYNTGRNLKDFLNAAGQHRLPKPDFAILGWVKFVLLLLLAAAADAGCCCWLLLLLLRLLLLLLPLHCFLLLLYARRVGTEIYSFPGVSSASHSHFSSLLTPEEQQQHKEDMAHRGDCWPAWCPERLFAKFEGAWIERMKCQFSRKEAEAFVLREVSGEVYINGNCFHDPLRLSVSIPTLLLEDALKNPKSDFCSRLKKDFKVCVSGGGDWRYLDLLPKDGGKLGATLYVMQQLGFTPQKTLVCGDSGNDIDMFCYPSILGCCVGNAHEVLLSFLRKPPSKTNAENLTDATTTPDSRGPPLCRSIETTNEQAAGETDGDSEPFFLRDLHPTPHVCFSQYPCAGGILDSLRFFQFDKNVEGLP